MLEVRTMFTPIVTQEIFLCGTNSSCTVHTPVGIFAWYNTVLQTHLNYRRGSVIRSFSISPSD